LATSFWWLDTPVDDSRETNRDMTGGKVIGVRRLKEAMAKPVSTRIFTVANQKGGVGKTTSTVNIAAAMAMGGLRVLVIDLDPQGNASTALGVEHRESAGVYEVLMGTSPMASVIQKVSGFPELDCVPSNTSLANAEINLVSMVARELQLKEAIDEISVNYDYIFIDCPPSLGLLTINAFAASRELMIPIQTEYYALEGLSQLLETYTLVKKRLNPALNLSTIILTMFDSRTRLSNDVAANVRAHFPNELIDVPIPRAVRVSEAPSYNQTVMTYDPLSPGAIAYMQVAREIAERGRAKEPAIDNEFNSNVVSINYKDGIA
jgi:chromosome partitioning protein